MAEQYVSIKTVQDRLARHPLLQGLTLDTVVDYTVDFMRIVGVPEIFVNKTAVAATQNHKIPLPCDYIRMVQMRGRHGMYRYATNTFHEADAIRRDKGPRRSNTCDACSKLNTCDEHKYEYNSVECVCLLKAVTPMPTRVVGNYYNTQNGVIFLSNREDEVEISYLAILTDGEGMPLIPDDSKFQRALTSFIKKEYFTALFDTGSIRPDVLFNAKQEYAWAVGACQNSMQLLDLPRMEALSNAMHGMINRNNEWNAGFVSNGAPEIMKKH